MNRTPSTLARAHDVLDAPTEAPEGAAEPAMSQPYASPRVQAIVLDYAGALRKLWRSLVDESGKPDVVERQVLEVRTALALARAALLREQLQQKRARHRAMHDGLTALPNRRFLLERLELALAGGRPQLPALAVLHVNLDGGHNPRRAAGGRNDALLKSVAARLSRAVRAEDMVCRLEGDQFACLLPGLSGRQHLGELASMLFGIVSARLTIDSFDILPRPNIGIAVFPEDGATADALLGSADAAMRLSKLRKTRYSFLDRSIESLN
jgi:diguanylate cyclase (GGDEF)-like protein